jgi:hypothetical protein
MMLVLLKHFLVAAPVLNLFLFSGYAPYLKVLSMIDKFGGNKNVYFISTKNVKSGFKIEKEISGWLSVDSEENTGVLSNPGAGEAEEKKRKDRVAQINQLKKEEYENELKQWENACAQIEREKAEYERKKDAWNRWCDSKQKIEKEFASSVWDDPDKLLERVFVATEAHQGDVSLSELSFYSNAEITLYSYEPFGGENWFAGYVGTDPNTEERGFIKSSVLKTKFRFPEYTNAELEELQYKLGNEPENPIESEFSTPKKPVQSLKYDGELDKLAEESKKYQDLKQKSSRPLSWDYMKKNPNIAALNTVTNEVQSTPRQVSSNIVTSITTSSDAQPAPQQLSSSNTFTRAPSSPFPSTSAKQEIDLPPSAASHMRKISNSQKRANDSTSSANTSSQSYQKEPELTSWIKPQRPLGRSDDSDEDAPNVTASHSRFNSGSNFSTSKEKVQEAAQTKIPAPQKKPSDSFFEFEVTETKGIRDMFESGKASQSREDSLAQTSKVEVFVNVEPKVISNRVSSDLVLNLKGFADPDYTKYKSEDIRSGKALKVDPSRKYEYLEDEEFQKIFGMSMNQFSKLTDFKRDQMLKKANLK